MNLSTLLDGTEQLDGTLQEAGDASGKNVGPHTSRGRGSREVQCSPPKHKWGVRATDRKIEVLAQDLPCYGGAQLAIDVTLRSAVGRNGEARPHAAEVTGQFSCKQEPTKRSGILSSRWGDAGLSWWQLRRADVGARRRSTSCGSCPAQRHETSLTL